MKQFLCCLFANLLWCTGSIAATTFFSLGSLNLKAAESAILRVDGSMGMITSGNPGAVGTPFHIEIQYPLPTFADLVQPDSSSFLGITGQFSITLGLEVYTVKYLQVETSRQQGGMPLMEFSINDGLGAPGPVFISGSLFFRNPLPSASDFNSLPASLDDWDLLSSSFSMTFSKTMFTSDIGFETFSFSSDSYTSLTLTTIPEPSVILFSGAVCIGCGLRRTRFVRGYSQMEMLVIKSKPVSMS